MKRKSLNANPIKREKERYQTCMLHTVAERERKSSHCEPKLTKRISSIFAEAFFNSVLKKVESEITVI